LTAIPAAFQPTHAVPFAGIVGSFTDPNTTSMPTAFSISVNWGDGTAASSGTASFNPATGQWDVNGSHTYALTGSYNTVIRVTDQINDVSTVINSTANAA
jgi:hypothetical protein